MALVRNIINGLPVYLSTMSGSTPTEEFDIFKVLSDNSPSMIFVNDFQKVVYVNMKCTEVLGFTREEFLNQDFNFIELVTKESREGITASLAAHCKGNEVEPTEYVLFTKTGKPIHVIS